MSCELGSHPQTVAPDRGLPGVRDRSVHADQPQQRGGVRLEVRRFLLPGRPLQPAHLPHQRLPLAGRLAGGPVSEMHPVLRQRPLHDAGLLH